MAYQVLYRTYRPQRFDECVGQEYIIKTLKNAIKLDKIAHAYLFAGPRGTGKTTIAKLFAKAINCNNFNDESCDECNSCKAYNDSNNPDIVELDAASNNGVEEIRKIIEEASYAPLVSKYKVYIIDEVHMLTANAFNALLKTLEEPPHHVVFILATTDPNKVIPTVLSRCQRYNFQKITTFNIVSKLKEVLQKENLKFDDEGVNEVAILAEGGMRDALSITEQVLAYNPEGVFVSDVEKIFGLSSVNATLELLLGIHTSNNLTSVINKVKEMYQSGIDIKRLNIDLLEIIKEAIIYSDNADESLLNRLNKIQAQKILQNISIPTLFNDLKLLEETLVTPNVTNNFLTFFEVCLIKMSSNATSKSEVKQVSKPQVKKEIKKEEVKEIVNKIEEVKEEINNDNTIDLDFISQVLTICTKEDKINDAIIYNRLDLYKFDEVNRKYYDLLIKSEIFASCKDAIILLADDYLIADSINSKIMNKELFNFIFKECGVNKMLYAIPKDKKHDVINKYRAIKDNKAKVNINIEKYEVVKEESMIDKTLKLFPGAVVED